jgi:hypothetical protein
MLLSSFLICAVMVTMTMAEQGRLNYRLVEAFDFKRAGLTAQFVG